MLQKRISPRIFSVIFGFLTLVAAALCCYVAIVVDSKLVDQGAVQKWIFRDGTEVITEVEVQPNNMIGWERRIECTNGKIVFVDAQVHSKIEYEQRFKINMAPHLIGETVYYHIGDATFAHSVSCK